MQYRRRFTAASIIGASLLCLCTAAVPAQAVPGINEKLNYQARLLGSAGAVVPDGAYNIEFKIYQGGDGIPGGGDETLAWTETRTGGNKVTIKNGYFAVQLGSVTPFGASVDWHQDTLWLSTNVGGTGGSPSWDGEMAPLRQLAAATYAFNTKHLSGRTAAQFLQISPDTAQTDSSTAASLLLNKTGASGTILQLQKNGANVLQVDNSGTVSVGNADTTGTLTVFDTKTDTGDPTGIAGGVYYNANNQRLRCYEDSAWKDCVGAPTSVPYITLQADPLLNTERVLTAGTNVVVDDGGANSNLTINVCSQTCSWPGDLSPSQLTTDQHDYNPSGLATATVLRLTSDTYREITGLAGGADGRLLVLLNTGAFPIAFRNQHSGSTAANRFALPHDYVVVTPNQSLNLYYDSTAGRWQPLQSSFGSAPAQPGWHGEVSFEYGWAVAPANNVNIGDGLISTTTGAGAANAASTTPDQLHPGIATPTTGSSSGGQAALRSHFSAYRFGGAQYFFATSVQLPDISNDTDDFLYYAGFGDSVTTEPIDGCYFRYNDDQASGQWQGVCRASDTESTTAGVTVAADTWYRLEMFVSPTTASFYVNGVKIGTDITTNIPTAAGRETGLICHNIRKTLGATARTADVDFCIMQANFTAPR